MDLKKQTKTERDIYRQFHDIIEGRFNNSENDRTFENKASVLWVSVEGLKKELEERIKIIQNATKNLKPEDLYWKGTIYGFQKVIDELVLLEKEKKE